MTVLSYFFGIIMDLERGVPVYRNIAVGGINIK